VGVGVRVGVSVGVGLAGVPGVDSGVAPASGVVLAAGVADWAATGVDTAFHAARVKLKARITNHASWRVPRPFMATSGAK